MGQLKKQFLKLFDIFKEKANIKIIIAVILFLFLNALKLTLFNYFLIPKHTLIVVIYKFSFTLAIITIIYPILFILKTRFILIGFYILQTIFILANISYYLYFHTYLMFFQWFSLFSEAFSATENLATPKSSQWMIIFIDLPILIYILIKYLKVIELRKKLNFVIILVIIFSIFTVSFKEIQNYHRQNSIFQFVKDRFKGENLIVERYGTVFNNLLSIYYNKSDVALIKRFSYGKEQSNLEEATQKPNYICIQIESCDSNIINKKYKDNFVMPYLNSMSNSSVYYPYVLSYHMGGSTSDSEFSIINSLQPLDGYPAIKIRNYDYNNSFLTRLSEGNYFNIAFHGNIGSFYNRNAAFPRMGFNQFYDMGKMNLKDVGWGAPDNDVFNYAFNKLSTIKNPYLSYIITMTSHAPFTNAEKYYKNAAFDDIKDKTVKEYFLSMSYVDKSIESFVNKVRSENKNTYIFIWGDHTPNIETEVYKQAAFKLNDKYFEFVPLMIITPESKIYKEEKEVASFIDIAPTILHSSGIKFNIYSDGQNLLDKTQSSSNIPYRGGSYNREKLFNEIIKNLK